MKTTQKTQLKLFVPFFDKELDYKNDFVSYKTVGGNSSVTPKSNNSISSQNKKYYRYSENPLSNFTCPIFNNVCDEVLFFFGSNIEDDCFYISHNSYIYEQLESVEDFHFLDMRVA